MNPRVVVVDYGLGNVESVRNMLSRIGADASISGHHDDIAAADRLVLPGVGHFDAGMNSLRSRNLTDVLNEHVLIRRKPVLGLCLGMQLFTHGSEEGSSRGLGWVQARTVRFESSPGLLVPHMGWNLVRVTRADPVLQPEEDGPRFYFVHSFHVVCENADEVLGVARHGRDFVAAIRRDNIWGMQFHPEKSHKFGMRLVSRFALAEL